MLNERERSPNVERRAVFFVGDIAVSAWLAIAVAPHISVEFINHDGGV